MQPDNNEMYFICTECHDTCEYETESDREHEGICVYCAQDRRERQTNAVMTRAYQRMQKAATRHAERSNPTT